MPTGGSSERSTRSRKEGPSSSSTPSGGTTPGPEQTRAGHAAVCAQPVRPAADQEGDDGARPDPPGPDLPHHPSLHAATVPPSARRANQRNFQPHRLGYAADKYGMELVAWDAMSNHYHAVVLDHPLGKLPASEHFHKMVARAMNARWKRWENFWSTEQTGVTYLPTLEAVLEKVCYVLVNPMNAHLVIWQADWPAASSMSYLERGESSTIAAWFLPPRRTDPAEGGALCDPAPLQQGHRVGGGVGGSRPRGGRGGRADCSRRPPQSEHPSSGP